MEPPATMHTTPNVRADCENRHWRAPEDLFRDRTHEEFFSTGAAVRAHHDQIDVVRFDDSLNRFPHAHVPLHDRFVLQTSELGLSASLRMLLSRLDGRNCNLGRHVANGRIRREDMQRKDPSAIPARYAGSER